VRKIEVSGNGSLEIDHPVLAMEWHKGKNAPVELSSVKSDSGRKFWWKCSEGHEWQAVVTKRVLGFSKCHKCLTLKNLSLFDAYPTLKNEFDTTKNHDSVEPLSFGSKKNYWWRCQLEHSYQSTPNLRAGGVGCPYCSNQKVLKGFNDMATTHPELAKFLDEQKSEVSATGVIAGTGKKLWWLCEKGHSSEASGDQRKSSPSACPVCTNKEVLVGFNDMATTNPKLVEEFDLEKNHPLTPRDLIAGTREVLWWICPSKGHSYQVDGMHRVTQGAGCPVCASVEILPGYNDMATKAPQLLPHFHPTKNFPRTPENLSYRSNVKLWWQCELGHEYQAKPGNRLQDGGLGCPVCSTHQILAGFNDLTTTRPDLLDEWHPTKNGNKKPTQYAAGTNKKVWWKCDQGHEWFAYVNLRARGRGCPRCSKGGFDNTKPGWFYLIENVSLRARKVGISNYETKRLLQYESGWVVVSSWSHENGHLIRALETRIKIAIRKEFGLPKFLSEIDMGRAGGASETFSIEGVSNEELIQRVNVLLETINLDEVAD
jgi:hypothetical protein